MSCLRFSSKTLLMVALVTSTFSPAIVADSIHSVEKRQIGVLARTGALPQGKRSVEVLARNGELPHGGTRKDATDEDTEDLLIDELDRAENLSKLRAQALSDKLLRQREYGHAKRSVAALARNGELPQKRLSEAVARSGYLIKPPQETPQAPADLLDPDDFLADGQSSAIPDYSDERSFRAFLSAAKRGLGSARNILLDSGKNSYGKRNLAALARDGGIRYPLTKDRKTRDSFDWPDEYVSMPTSRSVSIWPDCCDRYPYPMTISGDKPDPARRKRDLRFGADTDYEEILPEVNSEGNSLEKRFLGRIPQLGRIHQKVQAPSSRRRPHLRPNWL